MTEQVIKWSYSALKEYVNCPRQYHETRVLKKYEKETTKQMLYGTEVHKALEDYVNEGKPLLPNYNRFKKQVDALAEIEGEKLTEFQMALDANKNPCAWDEHWVRGIADLIIKDGDTAFIVDYKTGRNRFPDLKQLQLMALMVFAHFPEIKVAKTALLFVVHEHFIPKDFKREDEARLWEDFQPDLERLKLSFSTDKWQENPTQLCRWCPVKDCQFHRG